ncbi:MAG TPA: hypothetical protein VFM31_13020, partial [Nitrososphaeraceae archaeon]|nr:hypothetical protein [Nitrososphaeraceae archaeon]
MVKEINSNKNKTRNNTENAKDGNKIISNIAENLEQDSSKVKIGIIGVGGWGKNHSRVLHDFGVL